MKKLLFILCLALFSCSAEDEENPEEYTIFIQDDCPDYNDLISYPVSEEIYHNVIENVAKEREGTNEDCVQIVFVDKTNYSRSGWYGGANPEP